MNDKQKHLEFIQNVITRMNTNSFLIKGWAVTLATAIFALRATTGNNKFSLVSYLILPLFILLDAFYLSQEKSYRGLYNIVAGKTESQIDYSMDASAYRHASDSWVACVFSIGVLPFYLTIAGFSYLFMLLTKG